MTYWDKFAISLYRHSHISDFLWSALCFSRASMCLSSSSRLSAVFLTYFCLAALFVLAPPKHTGLRFSVCSLVSLSRWPKFHFYDYNWRLFLQLPSLYIFIVISLFQMDHIYYILHLTVCHFLLLGCTSAGRASHRMFHSGFSVQMLNNTYKFTNEKSGRCLLSCKDLHVQSSSAHSGEVERKRRL